MIRLAFDFIFSSRLFIPTYSVKQFSLVSEIAKKRGTEFIIFDKDDTITSLKQFSVQDQKIRATLQTLKQMNIRQKILSNSIKETDPHEMEGTEIMRLRKKKPYNQQEVRILIKDYQPQKVMIVGDRLMTDIYLANKLGIASILVPPVQPSTIKKHGLAVKILRDVQNVFLKMKGII